MLATPADVASRDVCEGTLVSVMRGTFFLATIALVTAALTGCTAPGGDADAPSAAGLQNNPTDNPPAATEVENSPPATPAPLDVTDPGSWGISFDGIGPLTMGGQLSEEQAFMSAFTKEFEESCQLAIFRAESAPDILAAARYADTTDTIVATSWVASTAVAARSPKTAEGIGVGSTLSELLEAYPDIIKLVPRYPGFDEYALSNGNGRWIHFSMSPDGAEYVVGIAVNTLDSPSNEICG
jgi:hypothetical protein